MRARSSTPSSICSATRRGRSWRISAAIGGAQSYPSRTKDSDDVDFSTGSVGLGAAQTIFASMVQDYVKAHGWAKDRPEGRMIALVGDAELDEGNIFEALLEGWKNGLRNTWWVIDYNRQSLDAVVREGLYERFIDIFRALGWDVVVLKYGRLLEAAFAEPGGDSAPRLDRWLPEPGIFRARLPGRRGVAQAAARQGFLGDQGEVLQPDRAALGRRACAADDQPRRPRPRAR